MDLKITSATKVGAIVLIVIAAFIFILTWLGVISPLGKGQDEYYLRFHFPSIRGLNKGAKIKINGNEVGIVEKTELSALGGVDVVTRIFNKENRIHENAEVIITKESLLGSSYIEVTEPIGGFYEKPAETSGQFYMQVASGRLKQGDYLHYIHAGKERIVGQVVSVTSTDQGLDRVLVNQVDKSIDLNKTFAFVPKERKIWDPDEKNYITITYVDIFPPLQEGSYFQGTREAGPEDLIAHVDQVVLQTSEQIDLLNQEMLEILQKVQVLLDDIGNLIDKEELETLFRTVRTQIESIGSNIESVTSELDMLVSENRERIDSIMINLEDTSTSIKDIAGDPKIRQTIDDLSTNLNEISTRINAILEDIEELTDDPQLKDDIREGMSSARETLETASGTMDEISSRLDEISQLEIKGELKARYQSKNEKYFNDLDFKLGFSDREEYILFGVDEIGEDDRINFQLGTKLDKYLDTRFGINRSKIGVGADYHMERFFLRTDLYDPNDLVFDAYAGFEVSDDLYLIVGGEKLFDEDLFNLGVLLEF